MLSNFRFPLQIALISITAFLLGLTSASAQISQEGTPMGLSIENIAQNNSAQKSILQQTPTVNLPSIPLAQLLKEDLAEEELTEEGQMIPKRFAHVIEVDYSLENSGQWTNLSNGDRLWQLEIAADNAVSLGFNYGDFYLPKGGRFFIYNEETGQKLGAYTQRNNKKHQTFSTQPIRGTSCILEYYEPAAVEGLGRIAISSIAHGYKSPFVYKAFGDAAGCSVDINCGEGDNWQDEKKGVAMIILGNGSRACSGSLINNTAEDCRPLFWSANHCITFHGPVTNWIFVFNYESEFCDGEDGSTDQSVQGATLLAKGLASDFALMELDDNPSEFYDVYFNGWDRSNELTSGLTCIQHPAGDVKKISVEFDSIAYKDNIVNGPFWEVPDWDIGSTEGGSSGSPLFNQHGRIIGQLTGGDAGCVPNSDENNGEADFYGKLSYSWNTNGTDSTERMDYWLDPLGLDVSFLEGAATPCTSIFAYNLELVQVNEPVGDYCAISEAAPEILVRNNGTQPITSFEVLFNIDGGETYTYEWEGLLNPGVNELITLPFMPLLFGAHTFTATLNNPNGFVDADFADNILNTLYFNNPLEIDCYCGSVAETENEWIASVKVGEMDFASGNDGGYADFSFVSLLFAPGQTYPVELIPGYETIIYPEHWRIWIDFDQNGSFEEANELVFDSGSASADTIFGQLSIPLNLPEMNTFMRVAMQFNSAPPPCMGYQYGEIEDYGVSISPSNPPGPPELNDPNNSDGPGGPGGPTGVNNNNPQGIVFSSKVLLQGPYMNSSNQGMMRDDLRQNNLIPQAEPYSTLEGFNHIGNEVMDLSSLEIVGDSAIVDWVLIELRDNNDPSEVVASQAVLLQRSGFCNSVDVSAQEPMITFPNLPQNEYYVSIRHRNHLGIMTAQPVLLEDNGQLIDFTLSSTETWGQNARINMGESLMAMWAGNSSNDGILIYQGTENDVNESFFEIINSPANVFGLLNFVLEDYTSTDINMDGKVIYQGPDNEPNVLFFNAISYPENFNNSSNFIINEQLP